MITKQCAFIDENGDVFGGIYCQGVDRNHSFVICGCCGGIYELDEITIIEIFPNWVSITEEIMGS